MRRGRIAALHQAYLSARSRNCSALVRMSTAAGLHPSTTLGFTANTLTTYERGRPDWLVSHFRECLSRLDAGAWGRDARGRFPAHAVVELGAGTGKSSRPLHEALGEKCGPGANPNLICVEPTAFGDNLTTLPGVTVVRSSADDLSELESCTAQMCLAAQAFHWFATEAALNEICRVLVPGGVFVACWNFRTPETPWQLAVEELIESYYDSSTPRQHSYEWKRVIEAYRKMETHSSYEFSREFVSDAEGYCDLVLSISVIAMLPAAEKAAIADRVRGILASPDVLFDADSSGTRRYRLPIATRFFVYKKT